ncbi:hypothetical protein EVAR_93265_1 [Eumeta japonica]|uniref:Uncharacterized protein n=1 Tax=Eumeta variegata TaxID=151549 RepID=A0A4C1TZ12_EUMVA|nr:hypothetical protein EVAR_93265_1 [Eumeta japonica]
MFPFLGICQSETPGGHSPDFTDSLRTKTKSEDEAQRIHWEAEDAKAQTLPVTRMTKEVMLHTKPIIHRWKYGENYSVSTKSRSGAAVYRARGSRPPLIESRVRVPSRRVLVTSRRRDGRVGVVHEGRETYAQNGHKYFHPEVRLYQGSRSEPRFYRIIAKLHGLMFRIACMSFKVLAAHFDTADLILLFGSVKPLQS